MDVEKFIEAVKEKEALWNQFNPNYKNMKKKTLEWKDISDEFGLSIDACRRKWKTLRSSYNREYLKKNWCFQEGPEQVELAWKYSANMDFLREHLLTRRKISPENVQLEINSNESVDYEFGDTKDKLAGWATKHNISSKALIELRSIIREDITGWQSDSETKILADVDCLIATKEKDSFLNNSDEEQQHYIECSSERVDYVNTKMDFPKKRRAPEYASATVPAKQTKIQKLATSLLNNRILNEFMIMRRDMADVKNDIKSFKSQMMVTDSKCDILPKEPFRVKEAFLEYDNSFSGNEIKIKELKKSFSAVQTNAVPDFICKNLHRLITNEVAQNFSWDGNKRTLSAKRLHTICTLKNSCLSTIPGSTEMYTDYQIKRFFHYARQVDRLVGERTFYEVSVSDTNSEMFYNEY